MKKFLILILFLSAFSLIGQSQSYTYIANRYEWLAGLFRALGVPAGSGPAAFQTGQRMQAGAIYYDSVGVDSGLYVWSGLSWQKAGSDFYAGEGMTETNDSLHLGGLVASPGIFYNERAVNVNRKIMHWTNGIAPEEGGQLWQFSKRPYSPFQFISSDTITSNAVNAPAIANPLSGIFGRRIMYMADGIYRTPLESYGHELTQTFSFSDSINIPTSGGDYNQPFIAEYRLKPRNNGTAVVQMGSNTVYSRRYEGLAAIVANMYVDNKDDAATDSIHVKGTMVGISPYFIGGRSTGKMEVDNVVFFQPNFFGNTNTAKNKIHKMIYFSGPDRTMPATVDSAYGWYDSSQVVRSYHAGNYVIGKGFTSSTDKLKVNGNVNISDSLNVGVMNSASDSTNMDIVLSPRTAGSHALRKIRFDQLGSLIGGVGGNTIYTGDGTLAGNRSVDANQNTFSLSNATSVSLISNDGPFTNYSTMSLSQNSAYFELITAASPTKRIQFGGTGIIVTSDTVRQNAVTEFNGHLFSINPTPASSSSSDSVWVKDASTNQFKLRAQSDIGGGDVTKVGTPSNHQWGVWTGDGTIKGVTETGDRVVITDANGEPSTSSITPTKLNYLTDVTSNIQSQLDGKYFTLNVFAGSYSPADNPAVGYWAANVAAPHASSTTGYQMPVLRNCKIVGADIRSYASTAGTGEDWSLYIRVNDTDDYLIATVGTATNERIFSNTSLNITLNAGDKWILKFVSPTWATNPATVSLQGYVEFLRL